MTISCVRCRTPMQREHIDSPGDLCTGCVSQTKYWMVGIWVALILLLSLGSGCSSAQLKTANDVYENVHAIREGLEAIPGVTSLIDAEFPRMTDVRVGLNGTYALKHALVPALITEPISITHTTAQ